MYIRRPANIVCYSSPVPLSFLLYLFPPSFPLFVPVQRRPEDIINVFLFSLLFLSFFFFLSFSFYLFLSIFFFLLQETPCELVFWVRSPFFFSFFLSFFHLSSLSFFSLLLLQAYQEVEHIRDVKERRGRK